MSKIYFEAMKTLPDEFVDDETRACDGFDGCVVAANPKFAPIMYRDGVWKKIDITPSPNISFRNMNASDVPNKYIDDAVGGS